MKHPSDVIVDRGQEYCRDHCKRESPTHVLRDRRRRRKDPSSTDYRGYERDEASLRDAIPQQSKSLRNRELDGVNLHWNKDQLGWHGCGKYERTEDQSVYA